MVPPMAEPGQGVAEPDGLGVDQLDVEVEPADGPDRAGEGEIVSLAESSPTGPWGRARGHDNFRRPRPPSAMIRAMWPKAPTSSPCRAKIEPSSVLARRRR